MIIDILTAGTFPTYDDGPFFTPDVTKASVYITPPSANTTFKNPGNLDTFQGGDQLILKSINVIYPHGLAQGDQISTLDDDYIRNLIQLDWLVLPHTSTFSCYEIAINEINYSSNKGIYWNSPCQPIKDDIFLKCPSLYPFFETYVDGDYFEQPFRLNFIGMTGTVSMLNVPALIGTDPLPILVQLEVGHTLPMVANAFLCGSEP